MNLYKPREPGSLHEALERALEDVEKKTGKKAVDTVASFLGAAKGTVYAWMEPDRTDAEISLLRAAQITERYQTRHLAEFLADKLNCDLVDRDATSVPAISHTIKELADLIGGLSDGVVDPEDRQKIKDVIAILGALSSNRNHLREVS